MRRTQVSRTEDPSWRRATYHLPPALPRLRRIPPEPLGNAHGTSQPALPTRRRRRSQTPPEAALPKSEHHPQPRSRMDAPAGSVLAHLRTIVGPMEALRVLIKASANALAPVRPVRHRVL